MRWLILVGESGGEFCHLRLKGEKNNLKDGEFWLLYKRNIDIK